jgi:ammonia channel protein AmtB
MLQITSGEQTVNATGAIAGTLSTSSMSGNYTISVRIWGLAPGLRMFVELQDTNSSTPFSDARAIACWHFVGGTGGTDAVVVSKRSTELTSAKFGAANTAFRLDVVSLDSGASAQVLAWIDPQ